MVDALNAEDVFELACQVERDAADFYRQAANTLDHPQVCDLLRRLASWESRHEQRYTLMKETLRLQGIAVKGVHSQEYKALAGLSIFAQGTAPPWVITPRTTPRDVLEEALRREHASLAFFKAMWRFVADEPAAAQIGRIVADEREHIATIQRALDHVSNQTAQAANDETGYVRDFQ
ncbi:MAG TPA: hypothetical protein ENN87_02175 [Phycisphaerales bacterium]|nr:hypothetical protein [Phycisphaerales bacterium]